MPIRFRCQHCHQLMGIARRKAGSEVQCPTCRKNVLVPKEDEGSAAEHSKPAPAKASVPAPLFEHSDFDEVLRGGDAPRSSRPASRSAGARAVDREEPASLRSAPASAPMGTMAPDGIYLSSSRATMLAVAAIVSLALAFGAGLLVGRYCLGG